MNNVATEVQWDLFCKHMLFSIFMNELEKRVNSEIKHFQVIQIIEDKIADEMQC